MSFVYNSVAGTSARDVHSLQLADYNMTDDLVGSRSPDSVIHLVEDLVV